MPSGLSSARIVTGAQEAASCTCFAILRIVSGFPISRRITFGWLSVIYLSPEKLVGSIKYLSIWLASAPLISESAFTFCHSGSAWNAGPILPSFFGARMLQYVDKEVLR